MNNSFVKTYFQSSILAKLIVINIGVFLLISVADVLFYLFGMQGYMEYLSVKFLALPANLETLAFRFYTPLTYMFLHTDFWHIFANMLWLICIKQFLESILNNRQLFGVYILGGLSGAFLYVFSYNVFPVFENSLATSVCLGASAAVTAYIILIAVLQPEYRVLFFGIIPMTFKWIAIAYVIFDVFQLTGDNAGGHFAHLGGAIFGLVFALQLKKGRDITQGFNNLVDKIVSVFSFSGVKHHKTKMRVTYNERKENNNVTKSRQESSEEDRKRMDEILKKISQSGYDNLTKEEKAFLFKMSGK